MMAQHKQSHPDKLHIDLGLIIFSLILIYMIANMVSMLLPTSEKIATVEVGKIVEKDDFSAIVLRNEQAVNANRSGYIGYYVSNGSRIAKNEAVCMINPNANQINQNQGQSFSKDTVTDMEEAISLFCNQYDENNYTAVNELAYQIDNLVNKEISQKYLNVQTSGNKNNTMYAVDTGIVCYSTDGMEGLSVENINAELFEYDQSQENQLMAGNYIDTSMAAYKIIYDEDWQLVIKPTREQLEHFKSCETVCVRFLKDNITAEVSTEIIEKNGKTYVVLYLSQYMVRYCDERYLKIEILWEEYSGLKIPESAITEKDFYEIPQKYIVENENSNERGLYVEKDGKREFIKPTIYKKTEEMYYLDPLEVGENKQIIDLNTNQHYNMNIVQLPGVYNVNKGYARFRLIEKLYTYGDYSIISDETLYGIELYDHILLNSEDVVENQVIY